MTKHALTVLAAALIAGCSSDRQTDDQGDAQVQRDAEAKNKTGIIGKTTQEIGKFDPSAGHNVVDSGMREATPGLGSLDAYGPVVQNVAGLAVQQRVEQFRALNGDYPTYEEFMAQIVTSDQDPLRLPVLPGNKKYYYDEATHTIVVVDPNPTEGAQSQ